MGLNNIASITTITPTATADATNLVDATYPFALQGVSLQKNTIKEVYFGGQAPSTSSPIIFLVSRDSTVGATLSKGTGLTDASLQAETVQLASPAVIFNTATTKPQRSATLHLMNLSVNAFGGIVRWVPKDGTEPTLVGAAASLGEISVSAFTGGTPGLVGGHMIYETN
jgi:hypothetical protein